MNRRKKRGAILITLACVPLAAALVWWMTLPGPNSTALVFVKYEQSPQSKAWYAELVLTNVPTGYLIRNLPTDEGKLFPAFFYRGQPAHSWEWATKHKAPAPTIALGFGWYSFAEWRAPARSPTSLRIPVAPGAPPRQVGIEYETKDSYQGGNRALIAMDAWRGRIKLKFGGTPGWRRHRVWCPQPLFLPANVATNPPAQAGR